MGFWAWFWIWLALVIGALIVLALIGRSLFNKLMSAGHQASRIGEKASALTSAIAVKPELAEPQSSVLADPAIAQARLKALQKAKIKKQERRQRRLIKSLKHFDPNESRFH